MVDAGLGKRKDQNERRWGCYILFIVRVFKGGGGVLHFRKKSSFISKSYIKIHDVS